MDDSLDEWLKALGETEAPGHVHDFKHLANAAKGKVFNCACGERRITQGDPNMAPSSVQGGGSIANCLLAELRDGMELIFPLLGGNEPNSGFNVTGSAG